MSAAIWSYVTRRLTDGNNLYIPSLSDINGVVSSYASGVVGSVNGNTNSVVNGVAGQIESSIAEDIVEAVGSIGGSIEVAVAPLDVKLSRIALVEEADCYVDTTSIPYVFVVHEKGNRSNILFKKAWYTIEGLPVSAINDVVLEERDIE